MSWQAFETRVRGKWVLAGEHAVLRGVSAIALPHPEFGLELRFQPSSESSLQVVPDSAQAVVQDILTAVQDEQQSQNKTFEMPKGKLEIISTIPIGAGLGSSAALCVAIGRWLSSSLGLNTPADLQDFATQLEHRFHGRSSGMDVAAIVAGEPISFSMSRDPQGGSSKATSLGVKNLPRFTFHDTGLRARTSDCVQKVQKLRETDPALAIQLDEKMGAASRLALEGLVRYHEKKSPEAAKEALNTIASAMRCAQECFNSWQLIPEQAKRLQEELLAKGALATKITGAGDGGMIVALWPN